MNKIISKKQFSERVFCFDIEAPLIAQSRKAGNFVIVRVDKNGERMPLTIADADIEKGTIKLVVQQVGLSSTKLCNLNVGDEVADIVGPLGNPTHIENYGTVICAGGGVGVAPMLPIIRALKRAGNRVLSVLAGRNKDLIIMEDEVGASSDETIIMTDDGSYGEKGVVTVGIEKFIRQEHIDKAFAIGPPIMMKFCCLLTQQYGIPTDVSPTAAKFGKQIKFADRRGIPFVWFSTDEGEQVKDIRTGEQVEADPDAWVPESSDYFPQLKETK